MYFIKFNTFIYSIYSLEFCNKIYNFMLLYLQVLFNKIKKFHFIIVKRGIIKKKNNTTWDLIKLRNVNEHRYNNFYCNIKAVRFHTYIDWLALKLSLNAILKSFSSAYITTEVSTVRADRIFLNYTSRLQFFYGTFNFVSRTI